MPEAEGPNLVIRRHDGLRYESPRTLYDGLTASGYNDTRPLGLCQATIVDS